MRSALETARALLGGGIEEPSFVDLQVEGQQIAVRLRRSLQARRVSLRVSATAREVVLTVPKRMPLRTALAFLDRHAAWVSERRARWPPAEPVAEGGFMPLRGKLHRIERVEGRGRAEIRGPVWVDAAPVLRVPASPERLGARVVEYLKAQARLDLQAAVARHCAGIERSPPRIGLRDPKGRWGSCSSKGALNFSWRLILAPSHVLDYVAAHEVAHLREMNHGPRFWRLVERLDPEYWVAEAWLKEHGPGLHRYAACS